MSTSFKPAKELFFSTALYDTNYFDNYLPLKIIHALDTSFDVNGIINYPIPATFSYGTRDSSINKIIATSSGIIFIDKGVSSIKLYDNSKVNKIESDINSKSNIEFAQLKKLMPYDNWGSIGHDIPGRFFN